MPRRHFLADLERIQRPGEVEGIINVRRGDDDGSFVCTFIPPGYGANGIEITGMIPELSDYPNSHQTILYASSEDPPPAATSELSKMSHENSSMSLPVLISTISHCLSKAMDSAASPFIISTDSDIEMGESSAEYDDDSDISVGGWDEPSEYYHAESENVDGGDDNGAGEDPQNVANVRKLKAALRKDLRNAKVAGFKVGVLGDWKGGMDLYVSLSIRVSKLGISDEAISAWRLDKRKYLVLLIHYSSYYQSLEKLAGESGGYHVKRSVEMCVGTATRYKPTYLEAMGAFSKISSMGNTEQVVGRESGELEASVATEGQTDEDGFQGIFVSRPLNELLNSRLIQLVKYRIQLRFGWDGAESYYADYQGRESNSIGQVDERYYISEQPKTALAPIVTMDALCASNLSIVDTSFPLVAMQFALRHLVRCTEFCLVCHTKVHSDFEALKPYVCSSPLCLYQYMSLGFGPSIEYEIVSQPTVVDLLVSFCYVAAKTDKLTQFPSGMNLTVPVVPLKPFQANYHRLKNELHLNDKGDEVIPMLKVGDWLQIHTGVISIAANEFIHSRVIETMYYPKIKLGPPVGKSKPPGTANLYTYSSPTGSLSTLHQPTNNVSIPDILQVTFSIYNVSFDTLTDQIKRQSLISVLSTLPSVVEMRNWLQRNTKVGEGASLGGWKDRISPAAMGILRWVIASNRSCIVPVDQELDPEGLVVAGPKTKKGGEQRVWGMGDWLQFRFAMGAPDKEQRFVEAVQSAQQRLNLTYPSLFAFHGSPLGNWHSIIREGLHFKQTAHGRAFGHGCYHSLDLSTSLGYSGGTAYNMNMQQPTWPQSALNIRSALCLNEIVNAPDEFVSKSPHLVVAQLEWIQTRYLFVQGADMKTPGGGSITDSLRPDPVHPQDEVYNPKGFHGRLIIPAMVSSSRTRTPTIPAPLPTPALSPTSRGNRGPKARKTTLSGISQSFSNLLDPVMGSTGVLITAEDDGFEDDISISTDTTDLLVLLSEDEEISPVPGNGKGIASSALGSKLPKPGAFIPGILDLSDLPQLEFPSYASGGASKRIQSDLKSIIKLQQTQPLEELGFYVNEDRTDNIYQWIVELHSFPDHLPLVRDMKEKNVQSIVLEIRFGSQYPMSPPFVRVIKPRFRGFAQGGGGHVTIGGALCMELLTNSGWSAVSSLESVLLQVRMAIGEETPPARLASGPVQCYSPSEAKEAYLRACRNHGWVVPEDLVSTV